MRRLSILAVAGTFLCTGSAAAGGVTIPIDEARIVSFRAPAATVYVGNPYMADVTMIDPRHAYVLGKVFGATNLIALDAKGGLVTNIALTVSGHRSEVVTLNLGAIQKTFACAGSRCEAAQVPGDDEKTFYEPNHDADTKRIGLATQQSAGH